jgi:UDP-glucose 4-epimerase
MTMSQKCLITGGAGFIGSHLTQKLIDRGIEVTVLDVRKPIQEVSWIQADIRDYERLDLRGFQAVYHLAALSNARKAFEHPHLCYETNVLGTLNVVHAALRDDVERIILASSCWVAGAQQGEVVNEGSLFCLPDVNTVYGASKLSQELICYAYLGEAKGPNYTVLRYGIPYGERMWQGLVVRAFMEMAETRKTISIMGNGKQYREFLYVGDLCEAQALVLSKSAGNKIYNLTGDQPVTIEQMAKEVIKHFPADIEYIPQTRIEPKLKRIDSSSAKTELGWRIGTSFPDGIARCAEWWRTLTQEAKQQ